MKLLISFLFLLFSQGLFAQKQNVAIIVEEHTDKFDFVFYCKIGFLVILGVAAIVNYLRFQKQKEDLK